jgi:hypothetical protein
MNPQVDVMWANSSSVKSPFEKAVSDWDEHGNAVMSSAVFKDEALSVDLESVMARDRRQPEDAVRNHP